MVAGVAGSMSKSRDRPDAPEDVPKRVVEFVRDADVRTLDAFAGFVDDELQYRVDIQYAELEGDE